MRKIQRMITRVWWYYQNGDPYWLQYAVWCWRKRVWAGLLACCLTPLLIIVELVGVILLVIAYRAAKINAPR